MESFAPGRYIGFAMRNDRTIMLKHARVKQYCMSDRLRLGSGAWKPGSFWATQMRRLPGGACAIARQVLPLPRILRWMHVQIVVTLPAHLGHAPIVANNSGPAVA
jgi:hypothetical protein